jgi:hypothetical protein
MAAMLAIGLVLIFFIAASTALAQSPPASQKLWQPKEKPIRI